MFCFQVLYYGMLSTEDRTHYYPKVKAILLKHGITKAWAKKVWAFAKAKFDIFN